MNTISYAASAVSAAFGGRSAWPRFRRTPQRLGTEFGISAFERECTKCHGNAAVERAPTPAAIRQMPPERIYAALTTGVMKTEAANLTDEQKRRLAEYMGGRPLGSAALGDASQMPNRCAAECDECRIQRKVRPGMAGAWMSTTRDFKVPKPPESRPRRCRA